MLQFCVTILLFTAVASQADPTFAQKYLSSLSQTKKTNTLVQSKLVCVWKYLEYVWPCDYVKEFYQEKGLYDPVKNVLAGIDVYKNEIYVTVSRTSAEVPAGLCKLVEQNGKTLLQPFPNLTVNHVGKCSNLQFPISTSTDPKSGYMYVIDIGSVKNLSASSQNSTSGNPTQPCPPKLVVFDLKKNGTVVRSHDLTAAEPRNTSYLKDITLDFGSKDSTEIKFAYITDPGNQRLIVVNLQTNTSHSFEHDSMKCGYQTSGSISNIAVDPEFEYVYYNCLGSLKISQVPTSVLRESLGDFGGNHRYVGNTTVESNALVCGKKGLYYASANTSSVYRWNITQDIETQNATKETVTLKNQTVIFKNGTGDYQIDSLALDSTENLCLTQHAQTVDSSNTKESNFKIYRLSVNDTNVLSPDRPSVNDTNVISPDPETTPTP